MTPHSEDELAIEQIQFVNKKNSPAHLQQSQPLSWPSDEEDSKESSGDKLRDSLKRQYKFSLKCEEELEEERKNLFPETPGKKPRPYFPAEYDDFNDPPNLEEYLGQWDITYAVKIGICRTYANYLAASNRKK